MQRVGGLGDQAAIERAVGVSGQLNVEVQAVKAVFFNDLHQLVDRKIHHPLVLEPLDHIILIIIQHAAQGQNSLLLAVPNSLELRIFRVRAIDAVVELVADELHGRLLAHQIDRVKHRNVEAVAAALECGELLHGQCFVVVTILVICHRIPVSPADLTSLHRRAHRPVRDQIGLQRPARNRHRNIRRFAIGKNAIVDRRAERQPLLGRKPLRPAEFIEIHRVIGINALAVRKKFYKKGQRCRGIVVHAGGVDRTLRRLAADIGRRPVRGQIPLRVARRLAGGALVPIGIGQRQRKKLLLRHGAIRLLCQVEVPIGKLLIKILRHSLRRRQTARQQADAEQHRKKPFHSVHSFFIPLASVRKAQRPA